MTDALALKDDPDLHIISAVSEQLPHIFFKRISRGAESQERFF
jgi:hypothetical protein